MRNAVPRRGFHYFYCGWGDDRGTEEGFVQLIENEDDGDDADDGAGGYASGGGSRRFPRDFGIDMIGGMMDCDPVRFQRRSPSADGDRLEILEFCQNWKEFDWTLELSRWMDERVAAYPILIFEWRATCMGHNYRPG